VPPRERFHYRSSFCSHLGAQLHVEHLVGVHAILSSSHAHQLCAFLYSGFSRNLCSPLDGLTGNWEAMYDNYGMAVQSWGSKPSPSDVKPDQRSLSLTSSQRLTPFRVSLQGGPCRDCSSAVPNGPDPACKIVDCTAPCIVLASESLHFSLIDENNPINGGVYFVGYGMPPP
jgi:hypothetical protein